MAFISLLIQSSGIALLILYWTVETFSSIFVLVGGGALIFVGYHLRKMVKVRLHMAARRGDVPEMRYWLSRGYGINTQRDAGLTPLHWVAVYGHEDAARVLLEMGADVNIRDEQGMTPAERARDQGHPSIAKLIQESLRHKKEESESDRLGNGNWESNFGLAFEGLRNATTMISLGARGVAPPEHEVTVSRYRSILDLSESTLKLLLIGDASGPRVDVDFGCLTEIQLLQSVYSTVAVTACATTEDVHWDSILGLFCASAQDRGTAISATTEAMQIGRAEMARFLAGLIIETLAIDPEATDYLDVVDLICVCWRTGEIQ